MEFWGSLRRKWSSKSALIAPAFLGLFLINQSGCGKGQAQAPEVAGLSNFRAEIIDRSLYLSFRAAQLAVDSGLTLPIPGLDTTPPSTIALTPDLMGKGAVFQAVIALETLSRFAQSSFPLSSLPDGRPVPDTRTGVLPRWDMDIHGRTLSLYLSDEALGLYLPIDFQWANGLPFLEHIRVPLVDGNGNRFGSAHWLGGAQTAIFVLVPFTTSSRRSL